MILTGAPRGRSYAEWRHAVRSRPFVFLCVFLLTLVLAGVVGVARAQALDFRRTNYATGTHPAGVIVADLNNDGKRDLVTANNGYPNSVSVLLGNGSGGFASKTDFTTGVGPLAVAVGDFDKDGDLDIVTANDGISGLDVVGATVSLLLGNGSGGFSARTDYAAGTGCCSVAVGDFDGDGNPDLATANGAEGWSDADVPGNSVSVLLGGGSGGFSRTDFATGAYPKQVVVADLDKDGDQDLVTANRGTWSEPGSTVSVLLGDGSGGFAARTDVTTGALPTAVAVGDLDNDGNLDVVSANEDGKTVSVLLGDGSGGFAPKRDFTMGDVAFSPSSVVVADLNGDGKTDVATSNNRHDVDPFGVATDRSSVLVRLGNGDGTLAGSNELGGQTSFATGMGPFELAAADLNGDGRRDLVTANWYSNNVSVLQQQLSLKDVTVGNPVARLIMYKGKAKTVYGLLKPRHTAGTYPVRIYRWKRTASGKWKSFGYVKARVANYSSCSRYSKALSFPSRGKWRIRAYHPACSLHVAKWSAKYDYVTVR